MSKTTQLDREVSVHDRPQRPLELPAGFPDTPITLDPPLTPGEKQAQEVERARDRKSGKAQGRDSRGR